MKTALIIASLVLAGCASSPQQPQYAQFADCTLPVTREAGMGVKVPGCAAWTFGPTRLQRVEFQQRAAAKVIR